MTFVSMGLVLYLTSFIHVVHTLCRLTILQNKTNITYIYEKGTTDCLGSFKVQTSLGHYAFWLVRHPSWH